MMHVTATVGALVLGFLAGMLTFKRSQHWCPGCGHALRCVQCPGQPTPQQVRRGRS